MDVRESNNAAVRGKIYCEHLRKNIRIQSAQCKDDRVELLQSHRNASINSYFEKKKSLC